MKADGVVGVDVLLEERGVHSMEPERLVQADTAETTVAQGFERGGEDPCVLGTSPGFVLPGVGEDRRHLPMVTHDDRLPL